MAKEEQLLYEAAAAMAELIATDDLTGNIGRALERLGKAAAVDRVYVFENSTTPGRELPAMSQRYEWSSARSSAQIDNPELQNLPYADGFQRWYAALSHGESIAGRLADFPESERGALEPQSIRSILVLPIHIERRFRGFVGFDDCQRDRDWLPIEQRVLQTCAAAVGSAYVRMQAQRELLEKQRHYRMAVEAGNVGVWTWDLRTDDMELDPHLKHMLGYREDEIANSLAAWSQYVHPDDRDAVSRCSDDYLAGKTHEYRIEHRMLHRDGSIRWFEARGAAVREADGEIRYLTGTDTDITERKQSQERIEYLAFYDPLTALPNFRLFSEQAGVALAIAARQAESLAVLCLDLDHFKKINDSLGHRQGDELLKSTSRRLLELVREADTLCRLGSDGFVLLLPGAGEATVMRTAESILAAFRQPFHMNSHRITVTLSIGVALFPQDGADFGDLLRNADSALSRAKNNGRNRLEFYNRDMNASTFEFLLLESELREALRQGQLVAHFQPKVRLSDGALVGAEALVRWQHPERGLVPPGKFIPLAETSDLVVDIGEWMLDAVCAQLAVWREQRFAPVSIAVNIAARHFDLDDWIARIAERLDRHHLSPQLLELELTESTLLNNTSRVNDALAALKDLGVGMAIDDFGTGFSSLGYLKRVPLTTLKIDQSFVREIETDEGDRTLAGTITTLGHALNAKVVAEGVETPGQREILLAMGCDQAQGFLFGHLVPAEEFASRFITQT